MIEPSGLWTPNKFHIKKYSERVIPCSGHVGLGGWYRLEAVNDDGRSYWLTDWFHNNITNVGLDMCATSSTKYGCCQVGTGTATPTNADTTLQSFLAGTSTLSSADITNSGSPTYYTETYTQYTFTLGGVIGNISEVGIGPSSSSGTNLFSRELIRDTNGNPTTITVSSNQQLRVHYRLRVYPPLSDVTGTINGTIDGSPASRGFTRRAARVNNVQAWGTFSDGLFGVSTQMKLYTGSLGAITSIPGGSEIGVGSMSIAPYSSGSYSRTKTMTANTSQANGLIKSVLFNNASDELNSGNAGQFQVEFDTALNKTSLQTLTIEFRISWGRYTP